MSYNGLWDEYQFYVDKTSGKSYKKLGFVAGKKKALVKKYSVLKLWEKKDRLEKRGPLKFAAKNYGTCPYCHNQISPGDRMIKVNGVWICAKHQN